MTVAGRILGGLLGVIFVFMLSPVVVAAADPATDAERAAQFCQYLHMNGYVIDDCQWMSIVAQGQCLGLMQGRGYQQMMYTSSVMVGAKTKDAQWAILKTAVNGYCPIMDAMLPMSP
jgi:hypothetical protein